MPSDRQDWSEPTLGFLVHDVARLLRKRLEQRARAAGIGLTRAQWQTLAYLARSEGMNQASLAQLLDIEPITLVRLIDRLEAIGLVERRPDPRDRRQRNLYLTEKAWPELARIKALGAEVREEALAGLAAPERERLMGALAQPRPTFSRSCAVRTTTSGNASMPEAAEKATVTTLRAAAQPATAAMTRAPRPWPARAASRRRPARGAAASAGAGEAEGWTAAGRPLGAAGRRPPPPHGRDRLVLADRRALRLDRQRLCPGRHGQRRDRRRRAGREGRGPGQRARQDGAGAVPARRLAPTGRRSTRPTPSLGTARASLEALKASYAQMQAGLAKTEARRELLPEGVPAGSGPGQPQRHRAGPARRRDPQPRGRAGPGDHDAAAARRHRGPARRPAGRPGRGPLAVQGGAGGARQGGPRPRPARSSARRWTAIVANVRPCSPASTWRPARPAFALVAIDHVWIEANPKETDLTYVQPGQPVDRHGRHLSRAALEGHGRLSISPASQAEFSVLPAQNATGNWVKVVQRIPVRVAVETKPDEPPLRAGMSADVDDRHRPPAARCATCSACARDERQRWLTPAAARAHGRPEHRGADHRLRHAGDDHAGARHDDRQRRAAAHAGQPLGDARTRSPGC